MPEKDAKKSKTDQDKQKELKDQKLREFGKRKYQELREYIEDQYDTTTLLPDQRIVKINDAIPDRLHRILVNGVVSCYNRDSRKGGPMSVIRRGEVLLMRNGGETLPLTVPRLEKVINTEFVFVRENTQEIPSVIDIPPRLAQRVLHEDVDTFNLP